MEGISINILLSEFIKNKSLDLKYAIYHIIFDIDKITFTKNIISLYFDLLYKLYYYNKKIVLVDDFNLIDKFFYIDPVLLHTNQTSIDMFLALESWYTLFDNKQVLANDNKYELEPLNKEQLLAVNSIKGVVNVTAPAGSGKTKTLVNRIVNLLNLGVKEDSILVLVYNKKAETELVERLEKRFSITSISVNTFHSFGNSIIKKYTNLNFIEDDSVTKIILNNILNKRKRIINETSDEEINNYVSFIKQIKEGLLSKEDINKKYKNFYPIYKEYLKELEYSNYYTYEDMLYITLIIILKNPTLRYYLQHKYQYILVDEFQDLNKIQLYLIKLLSLPTNNLFVVGDDDQMIYSFRGSSNVMTKNFISSYNGLKNVTLSINYRSYENIVRHANMLIKNNIERYNKDIVAFTDTQGNIDICMGNKKEQINTLLLWINDRIKEKYEYNDNIILCRYNAQVTYLKCYLRLFNYDTGYSYKMIRKIRSIINNNKGKRLKDIIIKYNILIDEVLIDILSLYDNKTRNLILNHCSNTTIPISITTVHKTKGNEYKNVCYYYQANNLNEEERRIFYVAVTRPKVNLLILCDKSDLFIREYALNNKYSDLNNRKLLQEISNLENKLFIKKCRLNLLIKDKVKLDDHFKYQINEDSNEYLNKFKESIKHLTNSINIDKYDYLLLMDEVKYRKTLKIK